MHFSNHDRIRFRRRLLRTGLICLLAVTTGCAARPTHEGPLAIRDRAPLVQKGQASFSTLEAAALEALLQAHRNAGTGDRGKLRVGKVRRVAGGYVYTAPERASATVWSHQPQLIRYRLGTADVATYVVHPRSGNRELDRHNERPNASERRVVDQLDPEGRPLYLLTPTLRVVRYDGGPELRSVGCLEWGSLARVVTWPAGASVRLDAGRRRCPDPSVATLRE
jgi:hypothetical protein